MNQENKKTNAESNGTRANIRINLENDDDTTAENEDTTVENDDTTAENDDTTVENDDITNDLTNSTNPNIPALWRKKP